MGTPHQFLLINSERHDGIGSTPSPPRPQEMLPLRIPPQTPNYAHAERQHTEDDLKRDRRPDPDLSTHSGQRAYKGYGDDEKPRPPPPGPPQPDANRKNQQTRRD